jgi:hypothetical protein
MPIFEKQADLIKQAADRVILKRLLPESSKVVMMNVFRPARTNLNLLYPPRPDKKPLSTKKPIPTPRTALAKKKIFASMAPKSKDTVRWGTHEQSKTPDGKFGPARQIQGQGDCWFISSIAAVANNNDGQTIMAQSIKKARVEGIDGYHVTFAGLPNDKVFISDEELKKCLDVKGGDADTRLMELAADRFFAERGNFKSLYIAYLLKMGMNQTEAETCFRTFCDSEAIRDPMTHNPIHNGAPPSIAVFMLSGAFPETLVANDSATIQSSDVMAFLNRYVANERDDATAVIAAIENPLGSGPGSDLLVIIWDMLRTELTGEGRLRKKERSFLTALATWLQTRDLNDLKVLQSAARQVKLRHVKLDKFVGLLVLNQPHMQQEHFNILRSGALEVLGGGFGYIGFSGSHSGTIERINHAANTFTYYEPYFPTVVHTGELSSLIQEIISKKVFLVAVEPKATDPEAGPSNSGRTLFEHSGKQRAGHLRQLYHHMVADGKIDRSESGPLSKLIQIDDDALWHVYDSDKNGVIEGGELKAINLRVDRWIEYFDR